MSQGFVHLRVHTEFSLSDGIVRIKPLVKACAQMGMPAVAVTDQGNLFGMVKFYKAAVEAGIKPLAGADVWVADPDSAEDRSRLVLLCRNLHGYRALMRLLSRSYLDGQRDGIPTIDRAWLEADHDGLLALSAGREGDVGRALLAGQGSVARQRLEYWRTLFPDAFYLELHRNNRPGDEDHVHAAVELAASTGTPVVATNDVRFLSAGDFEAHEARVCIHDGRMLDDPRRERRYSEQQYLRSPGEMLEQFSDIPQALENTVEIAKRCNLDLNLGENVLPEFPVPDGMTVDEFLQEESRRGLEQRLEKLIPGDAADADAQRQAYQQRLERELGVIGQMGFPGYFLIVADFIRWSKRHDIPVGPGRGSGAGSLVAYALEITDLDPLRYDLLFERFLNPERVSMPDFDVDFCMEKRDRVIEYVAETYGREKVSQICTHGTMAARAVVRDVGRVLGYPYGYVDRIAKLVPFEVGMTLERALTQEQELRHLYEEDEDVSTLLDLGSKLEGIARNVGKHAGGVVIAPTDLTDFSPLYCEPGGQGLATQYDKDDVEAVGLVKFDFLGLRTLTIIDWTVKAINAIRARNGEAALNVDTIPMDDRPAFDLLKRCATTAVFQLESRGMKDLIRRLQPDSFEDIVALVALFRPGPLQSGMVEDFIDRKHGHKAVAYPTRELHHDDLKPILKPTYGVILYQEQVMQIAQALGGYSLGAADLLRRAMGKKKPEEMAKQREIFLQGATAKGMSQAHAEGIFDLMEKFAGYGFNKSHSAAYALLSYQTAWLKAHHPAPFMAAVLSSDMDNTDKVVVLIDECRSMKLRVDPPDVNRSAYQFLARDDCTVVYGLGAVKGVGRGAIEAVIAERERGGEFRDLTDLCQRVDLKRANKRVLEALIRSGSMDSICHNRATAMRDLPQALQAAEQVSRNRAAGQNDMFGAAVAAADEAVATPLARPPIDEWEEPDRLAAEKETLGLYLTGHPIDRYESELSGMVTARLQQLATGAVSGAGQSAAGNGRRDNEPQVTAAGLVLAIRVRNTQSGGRMASVTLDDRTGRMEVTVFPEAYNRFRHLIAKDALLVVGGGLGYDEFADGYRVTAEQIMDIGEARNHYARRVVMGIDCERAGNGFVRELQAVLEPYCEGNCPVWLEYRGAGAQAALRLGERWRVRPTDELIKRLTALTQAGNVRVEY